MMKATDAYTTLAAKLDYPESKELCHLLEVLMTPEEAELAARLPASVEELVKELNIDKERVNNSLQELYQKGVIFPSPDGYIFAQSLVTLFDRTASDPRQDSHWGRRLLDAWEQFGQAEWYYDLATGALTLPGTGRVIPYYKVIANTPGVLPYEDIRELLKVKRTIALIPCPCRRMVGGCDRPLDVCLQFDERAEYIIKRGYGEKLSYEEALAAVDRAEEAGLIHQSGNKRWGMPAICNCCTCCCLAFRSFDLFGKLHETDIKSRYEARVDVELCNGCQICIDRCQLEAIDMVKTPSSKKYKAVVDPSKCIGCGACAIKCPEGALSLIAVRPPEFILE